VEVSLFEAYRTSTTDKNLHQSSQLALLVEIPQLKVEILLYNTSTKRSLSNEKDKVNSKEN
jgi:hypothetical protein